MTPETTTGALTINADTLTRALQALDLYTAGPDRPIMTQAKITPLIVENNTATLLLEATDSFAAIRIYLDTDSHNLDPATRLTFNPGDIVRALKAAGKTRNPVTLTFTDTTWQLDTDGNTTTGTRTQENNYPNTAQIWANKLAATIEPYSMGSEQLARLAKTAKILGNATTPITLTGNTGTANSPHIFTIKGHTTRAEIIQMPCRTQ